MVALEDLMLLLIAFIFIFFVLGTQFFGRSPYCFFLITSHLLQSMVALKDFMLLLILFIFIFIVLGTQLFGGNPYYTPANTATWRKGFASFYESFYTVSGLVD